MVMKTISVLQSPSSKLQKQHLWGVRSVVELLPSICEALGLNPVLIQKQQQQQKSLILFFLMLLEPTQIQTQIHFLACSTNIKSVAKFLLIIFLVTLSLLPLQMVNCVILSQLNSWALSFLLSPSKILCFYSSQVICSLCKNCGNSFLISLLQFTLLIIPS